MLHAIKPMIWQALQTLKDHKDPGEDVVKRSMLQVMSHNLSANGVLGELIKHFDANFPADVDKVDCKKYLDVVIQEGVNRIRGMSEKEQKVCVERAHTVCWELCRKQLSGVPAPLLTEESTKIWWKIFNTFAERDAENERVLYPIAMDWEEVDYWANVVLKVMALPTNAQSRKEREIMGGTALTFQDALVRFNAKLNENNGMYVVDQQNRPDVKYIESAMQELNVRLFEGIHLSGSLTTIRLKKNHIHTKWCVLYQLGLAFADNPLEVDSTNLKAFIPISGTTEVVPVNDKNGRPVRFQLSNGPDSWLFEANNVSVRNKWLTAIICLKYGRLPDYEKDFINRRKTRLRNREFDAEAKETLRQQKERTKKQMEKMSEAMEEEKRRHELESDQLRHATTEELHAKIHEHDCRMATLMRQMHELGQQYEQEKAMMAEQHEREMQRLVRQHGDQMGSVQSELEAELTALRKQMDHEREEHELEAQRKNARIAELEDEVTRLRHQLASLTKELEVTVTQHRGKSESFEAQLASQQLANSQLKDEAEKLTQDGDGMRQRIRELEAQLARDAQTKAEMTGKVEQLEASVAQQRSQSASSSAQLEAQQLANAQLKDEAEKLTSESHELRRRIAELETVELQLKGEKAEVERLTAASEKLEKRLHQAEDKCRRAIGFGVDEGDEILKEIIFQETGFNPQIRLMNECVNEFNISTAGEDSVDGAK